MARGKFVLAAAIVLLLFHGLVACAAEDLNSVLAKLDGAATRAPPPPANFEFDNVQTLPVPDTDEQTGTVYYQRSGTTFQMGVHCINQVNSQTVPKDNCVLHRRKRKDVRKNGEPGDHAEQAQRV